MDVFQPLNEVFASGLSGIADRIYVIARYLAGVFCILMIGLMGMKLATGHTSAWKGGMFSIIGAAIYIYLLQNAQYISEAIPLVAVGIAAKASGSAMSGEQFLNEPDAILFMGLDVIKKLWAAGEVTCADSAIGCLGGLAFPLPVLLSIGSIVAGFTAAAFALYCGVLVFKISLFLGMALIPLAIFAPSAMFGRGPVRMAVYSGVFMCFLCAVTGLAVTVFTNAASGIQPVEGYSGGNSLADALVSALTFRSIDDIARDFEASAEVFTWSDAWVFVACSLIFGGLIFSAHKLASTIANGGMTVGASLIGSPAGAVTTMARGQIANAWQATSGNRSSLFGSHRSAGGAVGIPAPKSMNVDMASWERSSGSVGQAKLGAQQKQLEAPGWSGKVVRGPKDWKYY